MCFFREPFGFLFSWGGALGGSVKDTGNHGGDRRRHHKADRRAERGKRGDSHHAVTVTGSELLVKWVLPKTSGRKAGVQVVLIK